MLLCIIYDCIGSTIDYKISMGEECILCKYVISTKMTKQIGT